MKKRTKIIILSLMVVLLGVTGWLNIALNNSATETSTQVTTTSYFATYRSDRQSARDQEILYYDAIIDNGDPTDAAVVSAKAAKLELIANMEKELAVEGLIKAQGFEDCVISLTGKKINVVVKASELTETEVAQISAIVTEQLNVALKNIVIIPA
ncbi:MAG: SpoIIIAH-like family protein [Clostridia bacterium]|nr:SpoIIIAH-like family protein [Clostridia bacterium]